MNYFRCGGGRSTHTATKIDVAKTPLASFESNVSGLYIPEILAYFSATQEGSGDPSPINPRAISGVSSVDTTRTGKNLCFQIVTNRTIGTDGSLASNNSYDVGIAKVAQGVKFTLSSDSTSQLVCSFFYRIPTTGETSYNSSRTVQSGMTITAPIDGFIAFRLSKGYTYIQFEKGETATPYEPYTGQTATTNLGGTYYGGYVNVTTGLMTVTDGITEFDGSEDEGWYFSTTFRCDVASNYSSENDRNYDVTTCNLFSYKNVSGSGELLDNQFTWFSTTNRIFVYTTQYSDLNSFRNALANNPLRILGKLATPQTVQLTPAQLEQLLGQNNVFCSSGDVAVKYWKID